MGNLANSMQDAIKIDTSVFAQAIKMNMNEERALRINDVINDH